MSKLLTLNGNTDQEILNLIFNDDIIVFEDVQGSKIWVKWDGSQFVIKPRSISNDPLNLIDLSLQKFYNPAVNYFNSLDVRVKSLLNKNWYFLFEYFADQTPANISYNRVPKNNLVLTSICKNSKYDFTVDELDEYARLFDVDMLPVIFQGKLTERMKEAIKYFINTSEDDLEYIFGEKSFAFFFYKILNPSSKNSFLMNDDYQSNIEKLIIKSKNSDVSFELLNPLYKRNGENNSTDFVEIYSLILINFLNFCQSFNMSEIKLSGDRKDEVYVYLICKLFNIYISEVKDDINEFEFVIPEFFDKEKFKINTELISNKLTKDYIKESPKLEYIFKVLLSSFSKKRKKPIGLFTENTVILFNKFVDNINHLIDEYLNRTHETELNRSGLMPFDKFLDFKYDVDGSGNTYPDIYDEFEKGGEDKKKDKGGKEYKGKLPNISDEKKL